MKVDSGNVVIRPRLLSAISISTGSGMLDVGINAAIGDAVRPVVYVEREAFAAANLAFQMEKGFIPQAPVWSDVNTITGPEASRYIRRSSGGRIDLLLGGIPCQPYSLSGHRRGESDDRDLWPGTLKAIETFQPELVQLENVYGFAASPVGLPRIKEGLEKLDYVVAAGLFSTEGVGGTSGRIRCFTFAAKKLANANRSRLQRRPPKSYSLRRPPPYGPAGPGRRSLPRYAPGPDEYSAWATVAEMAPAQMPAVEREYVRMGDGLALWSHRIRLIGNGVDPVVSGIAFLSLFACLREF